jgi:hypothetical protein
MDFEVEKAEDGILNIGSQLTEAAYERFTSGQLTQDELNDIYGLLQRWTMEGQELLKVLE